MSNNVRVIQGYGELTDGGLITAAAAGVKGLPRSSFTNLPVDVKTLQMGIDELVTAIVPIGDCGLANVHQLFSFAMAGEM